MSLLRLSIGNDAFMKLIKKWPTTYGDTSAGFAELKALAEELSGKDLAAFFTDWVLDADKPAWPQTFTLALSAVPTDGVQPGSEVTYTLTATTTGLVPLTTSTVSLDLSGVLADATVSDLPDGLSLDGPTLTWTIPQTAASTVTDGTNIATVSFPVTIAMTATNSTLKAAVDGTSLGGTCTDGCTSELAVEVTGEFPSTAKVTIGGKAKVGRTLKARTPRLGEGVTFSYRWTAGSRVVGTGSSLRLTPKLKGDRIRVTVIASRDGYVSVEKTSKPTAKVAKR